MIIVPRSPFAELDAVERRMRRFFDEFGVIPAPLPAADLYETDGEFVLEVEVPGFAEPELDVSVTDRTLVVKGERTRTKEEEQEGKDFRLQERLATRFERRFVLPPSIVVDKLGAEFVDGLLTVRAPKTEAATSHKVDIVHK
jgi:HSP20 family protein